MSDIRPSSQDAILRAAFDVFSRRPDATLADVAARAGVGRATLHRHYKSRDALLVALAQVALDELGAAVDSAIEKAESHHDALRLALGAIIPLGDRHGFLALEPVHQDPGVAETNRKDRAALIALIDGARAEGAFDRTIPTPWIAEVFDALIVAGWSMLRASEATPTQAADLAWRTFRAGLSTRAAAPHSGELS